MDHEYFEALYPESTREDEIAKLVSYLKEGSSCQVIGIPGGGRSTLLALLAHNRKIRMKYFGKEHKTTHFVLINFVEIRKRPLFDVMKFLFLNLTESLRERKMFVENKTVGDIFREHLKFNDELVLFQGFKEAVDYLALERHITIVFLFDRFEEYVPTVTEDFFANLRTLRNRAKYHFSVVFSVNRPLEMLLEPSQLSDYYEFVAGHLIYLHLFDKQTTDFRVSYIEKITGKKVPVALLSEIITATGGVGRLVKLGVEAALSYGKKIEDVESFLFSQHSILVAMREIWFSLTPAEQAVLKNGKAADEIVADYLQHVGLLKDNHVQIPLFAQFIAKEFSKPVVKQGGIVYDENTNEIRRGEDLLSDQLTASEFRLLRYLLQNENHIVEREALIDVVWQGMKSTVGITDQAVDQLIFRLRRKIEEDANNPQHLLTVKGRGFKFVG